MGRAKRIAWWVFWGIIATIGALALLIFWNDISDGVKLYGLGLCFVLWLNHTLAKEAERRDSFRYEVLDRLRRIEDRLEGRYPRQF